MKTPHIPDPIEAPITRYEWEEMVDLSNNKAREIWGEHEFLYEVTEFEDGDIKEEKHYLYRLEPRYSRGVRIDLNRLSPFVSPLSRPPTPLPTGFGWMDKWWTKVTMIKGSHEEPFVFDPKSETLLEDALGEMGRMVGHAWSASLEDETSKEDSIETILERVNEWLEERIQITQYQGHLCRAKALEEFETLFNRTPKEWEDIHRDDKDEDGRDEEEDHDDDDDDDDDEYRDAWEEAHAAVKENPMVYRQRVYDAFMADGGPKRTGILTQHWYTNNGDDQPAPLGGDISLEEEEWLDLSEIRQVAESCASERYDYGEDDQYKVPIADRMDGWSDIEQAWLGNPNSSSNSCSRPYNWIRHWVVYPDGPPIIIDPHFVMHLRKTPLSPVGLVPGSIEFYAHHRNRGGNPTPPEFEGPADPPPAPSAATTTP